MSPYVAPVEHRQGAVQLLVMGRFGLQGHQQVIPDACVAPAAETAVDGFPGSVLAGQITPRRSAANAPENGVDHQPVILGWTAGSRALRWQQRNDARPLLVRQFMPPILIHPPRLARFANTP